MWIGLPQYSHFNPSRTIRHCLLKIDFNIIISSTLLPSILYPLGFQNKVLIKLLILLHALPVSSPRQRKPFVCGLFYDVFSVEESV